MRIYLITNLVTGRYYVGQTSRSLKARWQGHIYHATNRDHDNRIALAIREDGPESFDIQQLADASTREEMNLLEHLWITLLDACNPDLGYNVNRRPSSVPMTADIRARLAEYRGPKASMWGRTHTQATKDKMSRSAMGNTRGAGHSKGKGRTGLRHPHREESKQAMSKSIAKAWARRSPPELRAEHRRRYRQFTRRVQSLNRRLAKHPGLLLLEHGTGNYF